MLDKEQLDKIETTSFYLKMQATNMLKTEPLTNQTNTVTGQIITQRQLLEQVHSLDSVRMMQRIWQMHVSYIFSLAVKYRMAVKFVCKSHSSL